MPGQVPEASLAIFLEMVCHCFVLKGKREWLAHSSPIGFMVKQGLKLHFPGF